MCLDPSLQLAAEYRGEGIALADNRGQRPFKGRWQRLLWTLTHQKSALQPTSNSLAGNATTLFATLPVAGSNGNTNK